MVDRTNELTAWDRDHFFHPSTHMADHARGNTPNRIIVAGEGVHIVDRDGRRSLDAFAGLYCVNAGYGRREIAAAIAEQAGKLPYYHAYVGHGSEPSIRLAKMIIDRAPTGMSRVYFGLSGSDANETNIKLIWYYNNVLGRPEKKKIISRWRGYHGSGVMTGSLTGLAVFHNAFDLPRAPILHTEAPYYFRRADRSLSVRAALRGPAGGADPRRGSRHDRRVHWRAGARHRRHRAAAARLLGEDPGRPQQARHPAGRRRGHHRLRPARLDVRLRSLRDQA
jgi:L-2,4-diaminobutyrate transaminase